MSGTLAKATRAQRPWWRRIMPPVERLTEAGSTTATTAGVFLAYASSVFLVIAFVPMLGGDFWAGVGVAAFAVGSWVLGHWLVGR